MVVRLAENIALCRGLPPAPWRFKFHLEKKKLIPEKIVSISFTKGGMISMLEDFYKNLM